MSATTPPTIPSPPSRRWRRRVRWTLCALVVVVAAIVLRRPLFLGNFGVVDQGRIYRSSQPVSGLEETVRRNGLGSVINLRGGTEADYFYRNEVEVTSRLGIDFFDIPMSATQRPSRRELIRALSVLDQCRYPVLVHCKWGSDRTGLLCALYRLAKKGDSPAQAASEFTIAHGHFPIFGPERLHEPFDEYAQWLRDHKLTHDPDRFRLWLERDYRSDDPFVGWPSVRPGPRPRDRISAIPADRY